MAPECYILFFYGLIKCWTHLSAIDTASSDTVLSNCFLIHIIIIIFFFFLEIVLMIFFLLGYLDAAARGHGSWCLRIANC